MKGLRLFVRPIEGADQTDIDAFLTRQNAERHAPACGLLGKLLGDIVAVVALDFSSAGAMRVDDLYVARELRRKRIGKVMMREVEQLAKKLDRQTLVIDDARDAHEFLRRVGFEPQGDRWVRDVR